MKTTIVSNKGNFQIDNANVVLLPNGTIVLCYPVPNMNGSTDYHIGDLVINNNCFFETQSSLSFDEFSNILSNSECKKIKFTELTVFLLNDVIEKGSAYKYYLKYLQEGILSNKENIGKINLNQNSYIRTLATAHEDNDDLVLILYTFTNDNIVQLKFKDEETDNYLFVKNIKRVHTVRLHNTTLLKYAADLVSKRDAGNLDVFVGKDGKEYCLDYLVINYVVQKIMYINDSSKARNILSDDYIYISKMTKDRKFRYKYHYKKDKSLFIGFNSNVRLDDEEDELLLINNSSFYHDVNE